MRVFMLGWEFPPFISGGLGTACHGLTRALAKAGHEITFVLPKAVGADYHDHVRLLTPQAPAGEGAYGTPLTPDTAADPALPPAIAELLSSFQADTPEMDGVTFKAVPSRLHSPYDRPAADLTARPPSQTPASAGVAALDGAANDPDAPIGHITGGPGVGYHGDVLIEAQRYALFALRLATEQVRSGGGIDVVHAHDWMTYPAAMAVAAHTGRPFVVHVHSTEYDRAGEQIDGRVADIERRACHAAMRVIAVSKYTRSILVDRYGVPEEKIDVVYNGIDERETPPPGADGKQALPPRNGGYPTVLYLGRVTMQKGPEYFIQAAKRVLEKVPDTRFVVAGSGDKVHAMIELAAREGIGQRVFFTGFLRGSDVDRAFRMADAYVMPSVSEPFGIAALEAIRADVPVIVSKQSGVAEVIQGALKVDFWDTNAMAEKIIAVLSRPPLASTMTQQAEGELKKLTWGEAASRAVASYESALAGMS